jgi:hypothetical protein
VNAQTPAIMAALAVVGEAWLATLPDVAAGMAAIDRSLVLDGAVWRPWDVEGRAAFPGGLNLAEALGATYVMRWTMRWTNGSPPTFRLSLPVARAMLVLRRAAFPAIPFRPRDPVAEDLQRRIRAMEVAEAPRRPVEVLTPYTAPSDIGRNWR